MLRRELIPKKGTNLLLSFIDRYHKYHKSKNKKMLINKIINFKKIIFKFSLILNFFELSNKIHFKFKHEFLNC